MRIFIGPKRAKLADATPSVQKHNSSMEPPNWRFTITRAWVMQWKHINTISSASQMSFFDSLWSHILFWSMLAHFTAPFLQCCSSTSSEATPPFRYFSYNWKNREETDMDRVHMSRSSTFFLCCISPDITLKPSLQRCCLPLNFFFERVLILEFLWVRADLSASSSG